MQETIRIRSVAWLAAAALLAVMCTLLVTQAWSVDAAPGDTDATFVPTSGCRLTDTRPAPNTVGPRSTPLGAGEVFEVTVHGSNGNCTGALAIPTDAVGVALNVTAVGATTRSNIRLYPANLTAVPTVSNLNVTAGAPPTPNKVDVQLSPDGKLKVYNNNGSVDILMDVVGFYTKASLTELATRLTDAESRLATAEADVSNLKAANATQDAYIQTVLLGTALVPSGQTVTGYGTFDHSITADNEDAMVAVQLPGRTSAPLSSANVNFAPDPDVGDGDATCSGTTAAPTAPPGKVCLYLGSHANVDGMSGYNSEQAGFEDQFFLVQGFANGAPGGDLYYRFSWAYTAP